MAWKRMVLEIGMGTDIRGGDSTKAAVRALKDALWHNSLSIGAAVGQVLPHGTGTCEVVEGGLRIPNASGTDVTLIAHAAAAVYLDIPETGA